MLMAHGILNNGSVDEDIQQKMVTCLRYLIENRGDQMQHILANMPAEERVAFSQRLGMQ